MENLLRVCVKERWCAAWNWLVSWLLIWEFSYLLEDMALCGWNGAIIEQHVT